MTESLNEHHGILRSITASSPTELVRRIGAIPVPVQVISFVYHEGRHTAYVRFKGGVQFKDGKAKIVSKEESDI